MNTARFNRNKTPSAGSDGIRGVPFFRLIPLQWWTLLLLMLVVIVVNPNFYIPNNLTYMLRQATPAALLAIGETFVILSGGFDLSIGSIVSFIAALASGTIAGRVAHLAWALPICVLVGSVIGLVNGVVVTKLKVPSFLATLGMMIILQGAALLYTGGMPKGGFPEEFRDFGLGKFIGIPYIVYILVAIVVFSQLLLRKTKLGRSILAVGGNDVASNLMGIRVDGVRIFCFFMSSLLSTVGTLLMVTTFRVWDTTMGIDMEFEAITMVIVGGAAIGGGKGSIVSTILGWLIMTVLFTLLNVLGFPQSGRLLVQGLVILLAVFANVETRKVTR